MYEDEIRVNAVRFFNEQADTRNIRAFNKFTVYTWPNWLLNRHVSPSEPPTPAFKWEVKLDAYGWPYLEQSQTDMVCAQPEIPSVPSPLPPEGVVYWGGLLDPLGTNESMKDCLNATNLTTVPIGTVLPHPETGKRYKLEHFGLGLMMGKLWRPIPNE